MGLWLGKELRFGEVWHELVRYGILVRLGMVGCCEVEYGIVVG